MLVNYTHSKTDSIAVTLLGDFVDRLIQCPRHQRLGWSEEVMAVAAGFRRSYPALQFKVKVQTRKFLAEELGLFASLYQRDLASSTGH